MRKIYLLRHGQSEWNLLGKVQGQSDIELNDKGIEQAQKAAKVFLDKEIDAIYSSDLKRAYQTAEIVGDKLNLKVNTLCGIREMNFGTWEGLPIETIEKDHIDHYKLWRTEPHEITFVDGENLKIVQARALADVKKIMSETSNKNILLVSHGTAIKALILGLLDIDISKYNKMAMGNTGISIIEFRDFSAVLTLLNDTNHLRED